MDSLFFLALPRQAVLPKWNKSFSFKEQVDPQAGDVSRRPSNANGLTVSLQVDPKDDSSRKGSYGSQFSDDMDIAPYMPPPPYAQLRQVSVSSGRGLLRKDSDSPSLATSSTMSSRQGSFAGSEHLSEKKTPAPEVYHVFTSSQKRRLIYLVSAAALFSPLSSNIYFPALAQISEVRISRLIATNKMLTLTGSSHPYRATRFHHHHIHDRSGNIAVFLGRTS